MGVDLRRESRTRTRNGSVAMHLYKFERSNLYVKRLVRREAVGQEVKRCPRACTLGGAKILNRKHVGSKRFCSKLKRSIIINPRSK